MLPDVTWCYLMLPDVITFSLLEIIKYKNTFSSKGASNMEGIIHQLTQNALKIHYLLFRYNNIYFINTC